MYRLKRRQLTLVLIIFILFLLINVGYAYLNKELSIMGATFVNSFSFDVGLDDNYESSSGSASCSSFISGDEYEFNASLTLPDDSCSFTVDIDNNGSLPAFVSLSMNGSSLSFPYTYNSNGYTVLVDYSGSDLSYFDSYSSGTVNIHVSRANCDDDSYCSTDEESFRLSLDASQTTTR